MILVIIGLAYGFERLIKEMDNIAGRINEKVVMQIGDTDYNVKNADYFRFIPRNEIEKFCNEARIVVCHAGVGSMLSALKYNKPIIAVPREMRYGEAVDDHQLEIAMEWEKEGRIIAVYDIKKLYNSLLKIDSISKENIERNNGQLIKKLKIYIENVNIVNKD